ncbi:hypothetical protein B0A58_08665 [Flavobacterium branchiophilum NBRC 15030 = ATCC 35035]|uniref:Uncharacterized protein n=1 Tax=Flavobacterium branchiophilum TaxID=55197 RepID=A0A543G270_9FLAO|nr:hypothetical protein [Flavobacterium branchiophilum]OXA75482.1 hypothetical protein B0A58_08665 [Flavobacterium branchiophilum NBRC 15030 = ATCC 35035]TQM40193.1 hypothetical protein BC670_1066 [Flavobacterium branchiophilum]GEM56472.1 hypothetical protein FB1_26930 [Flavobacterium branchiophilum NBRC 15030 = ATCC 35035]
MKNTYLPINWTDGVKLTKDHFINNYFNFIATTNDYSSVRLNNYNYGIIEEDTDTSFEMETKANNANLEVSLKKCHCIAKNGHLIVFNADIYGEDFPQASLFGSSLDPNATDTYYVIVSVNPYNLIPVGIPDPEVVPLHHPNAAPEIKLHIINKNEVNAAFLEGYFLILKKYNFKNGVFDEDTKYIPPVSKLKNNKLLIDFNKNATMELEQIYDFSIKIHKKNIHNSMNNKLVLNTFSLCEKIIGFYTDAIFFLRNRALEEPPIFMLEKMVILSNSLMATLSLMDEKEKEMLLQYYYEWVDVKPSELLQVISQSNGATYDHNDIYQTLEKIDQFIGIIKKLWKKLSELEYIGVRKENIVISEETKTAAPKSRTWSILD